MTKPKREGPLKVPMDFDEAIKRALKVKPPPEGWRASERAEQGTKALSPRKQAKPKSSE